MSEAEFETIVPVPLGTNITLQVYDTSEADNVIAEKDAKIRRLRRALYKACANWADVEVFERTIGIDDPNVEANRWALMRNKCLKKAEKFKEAK